MNLTQSSASNHDQISKPFAMNHPTLFSNNTADKQAIRALFLMKTQMTHPHYCLQSAVIEAQ